MTKKIEKFAVIVAGGSGSRMQSDIPKQFIEVINLPILMHTIKKFKEADEAIKIIVVLPEKHVLYWKKLCSDYTFEIPHKIKYGGNSRFQSVKNGIEGLTSNSLVAIHDGVRPFTAVETIANSYKIANEKGNAITAIPLKDSIREVTKTGNLAKNRTNYRLIQTPQTFKTSILQEAYNVEENKIFTDDASVIEFSGHKVNLIEGSYQNIKITTPEDLLFARVLLEKKL